MTRRLVYEVAKDLGVRSSDVIEALKTSGSPACSVSASLSPRQIEYVESLLRAREAAHEPKHTFSTKQPRVSVNDLPVLERVVLKRQNRPSDWTELHPIELEIIKHTVRDWASADAAFATPAVLDLWLDTGLKSDQARLCLREGIEPWMLEHRCVVPHRRRPNEILTNGEAIKYEVVAPKRIAQALREQGVLGSD